MATPRADKLKKISMPKKAGGEREAEHDLDMLEAPAPEDTYPDNMDTEDELGGILSGKTAGNAGAGLDHISDDDLIAELKNRGLVSKSSPLGKAAESDLVDESKLHRDEEGSPEEEATETPEEESEETERRAAPSKKVANKKSLKY